MLTKAFDEFYKKKATIRHF